MSDLPAGDLWAWHGCTQFRRTDGTVLAWRPATDARAVLPAAVSNILRLCSRYHTLDRHIELLRQEYPGLIGDAVAVRSALEQAARAGLLANAREAASGLNIAAEAALAANAICVVISTSDRPAMLSTLLEQLAADNNTLALPLHLRLLDGSREAVHRDANRRMFAACCERNGWHGRVLDVAGMDRALAALQAALPDDGPVIRFLLQGGGADASRGPAVVRNWSLLLSAGHPTMLVDDRWRWPSLCAPSPAAPAWYDGQLDLLPEIASGAGNTMGGVLHLVGRGVGVPVARALRDGLVDLSPGMLDGADPTSLAALSGAAPLVAVIGGISLAAIAAESGQQPSLLTLSDAAWESWLGESGPSTTSGLPGAHAGYCIGYRRPALATSVQGRLLAVDNRRLLPPALPGTAVMAGQFALALKALWPDAPALAVPAILRAVDAAPAADLLAILDASPQRALWAVEQHALAELAVTRAGLACGPGGHLAALARCYEELGTLSVTSLHEWHDQVVTRYRVDMLNRLADVRRRWPRAVPSRLAALGAVQASFEHAIATGPELCPAAGTPAAAQAADVLQGWRDSAAAIRAWPFILSAGSAALAEVLQALS